MTCNDAGMYNVCQINSAIKIGNGKTLLATKIGDMRLNIKQSDGTDREIILTECKYVPQLWVNLFSITKALSNGWNISNNGLLISLRKHQHKITFDKNFRTDPGQVTGIEMIPVCSPDVSNVLFKHGGAVDYNVLHRTFGHVNEVSLRKTASYYGIKVTGKVEPCYECSISKARQKDTSKHTESKLTTPAERLFIYISSSKAISFGGSKYWMLIVDDYTDKCWSAFMPKKSDLSQRVVNMVKQLKAQYGKTVKFIRLDDSGENKALESLCQKEGLGIQFEFTGPGTPQYNGRVERKFATLYAQVQTMLNGAKVPKKIRDGVWTEAAQYSCDLENMIIQASKMKSPDNLFFEDDKPTLKVLREFGEIGIIVNNHNKAIRAKLEDRGKPMMFLGHAKNHSSDTFRFLNFATNRIVTSRDVQWLGKTYGDWKGITSFNVLKTTTNDDDDDAPEILLDLSFEDKQQIDPTPVPSPGRENNNNLEDVQPIQF
jgi:hypothetical protein